MEFELSHPRTPFHCPSSYWGMAYHTKPYRQTSTASGKNVQHNFLLQAEASHSATKSSFYLKRYDSLEQSTTASNGFAT